MCIERKRHLLPVAGFLTLAWLAWPVAASAHVDSPLLTDSCGSCHVGHGLTGQPMLEKSEEDFCYQCHGSDDERARMVAQGRLVPDARLRDLRREFEKPYAHPVLRGGGHSSDERLPRYAGAKASHAECVDCHNPHDRVLRSKQTPAGVPGYSLSGQYREHVAHEYEICFKCHSDFESSVTGDVGVMRAFATSVRSMHPVTVPATGRRVPSLPDPFPKGGLMLCSDCHRSDDPSAPAGPHGSNHEFLLSGNYDRGVYTVESSYSFEFCYGCHDRFRILGDESFPYHRLHIEGDLVSGRRGTSCFTCHASHGSPDYPHLIRFNPAAVQPADAGGPVRYEQLAPGSGTCVLKCHGVNHDPGEYP